MKRTFLYDGYQPKPSKRSNAHGTGGYQASPKSQKPKPPKGGSGVTKTQASKK